MLRFVLLTSVLILSGATFSAGPHQFVNRTAAAQSSAACSDFGALPVGTGFTLLACHGAVSAIGNPSVLRVQRQRFGPRAAVSPQWTQYDRLLLVEEGELVIGGATYGDGASLLIAGNDSYGVRNDTAAEAWLLTLEFDVFQGAGGLPFESAPRVGSADAAGQIINDWTSTLPGYPTLFVARMTLPPAAAIGPISHPGPVGLMVESGSLVFEHYGGGYTPGADYAGQRAAIASGERILFEPHATYRAWNDSGATVNLLVMGAVAADRQPIERSPGTLAFSAQRGGQWDLLAYDLGADAITELAADPGVNEWKGYYSHDGGHLAYLSDAGGSSQAWVMNADGTNARRVTAYDGPGEIRFVAWDEGDRDLVLTIDTGTASSLMRVPVTSDRPAETIVSAAGYAAISRYGSKAYVTQPGGDYASSAIVVEDFWAGTTWTVSASGAPADAPSFNATGSWIAYQVGEPGARYIEAAPLIGIGGSPFALSSGVDAYNPVWFPDGEAIAFVARRGQQPDIWTQSIHGGSPTPLGLPPYENVRGLSWRR